MNHNQQKLTTPFRQKTQDMSDSNADRRDVLHEKWLIIAFLTTVAIMTMLHN